MLDNATVTLTVKELKKLVRENTDKNLKETDQATKDLIDKAHLVCGKNWYGRESMEDRIEDLRVALDRVRHAHLK